VTHRNTPSTPPHPRDTLLQRLGTTLRYYRKQRRLSQQALAARTSIHHTYISEIELGQRNISVLTLLRLTHVLEIPISWLLTRMDACAPLARGDSRTLQRTQDAAVPHDDTPSPQLGGPDTLLKLLSTPRAEGAPALGEASVLDGERHSQAMRYPPSEAELPWQSMRCLHWALRDSGQLSHTLCITSWPCITDSRGYILSRQG